MDTPDGNQEDDHQKNRPSPQFSQKAPQISTPSGEFTSNLLHMNSDQDWRNFPEGTGKFASSKSPSNLDQNFDNFLRLDANFASSTPYVNTGDGQNCVKCLELIGEFTSPSLCINPEQHLDNFPDPRYSYDAQQHGQIQDNSRYEDSENLCLESPMSMSAQSWPQDDNETPYYHYKRVHSPLSNEFRPTKQFQIRTSQSQLPLLRDNAQQYEAEYGQSRQNSIYSLGSTHLFTNRRSSRVNLDASQLKFPANYPWPHSRIHELQLLVA